MGESTNNCRKCLSRIKNRDPYIKCNGKCNSLFHSKCVDMSSVDMELFKSCNGLRWFCEECSVYLDNLWDLQKEICLLKNDLTAEITELKNKINSNSAKVENIEGKKSYAKAVTSGEVVVIKPKEKQESKKTMEAIQKHVNPVSLEVGITEVKNIKEGGVLIKCKSKEEVKKIQTVVEKKLSKNYKINTPDLKRPCIKILDIDQEMDEDELINSLKKQNFFLNTDGVYLKVIAIKKMKSNYMAIIECDPSTFKKVQEENVLSLNWSRCRVFEYVGVLRCYRCGGFNHKADQCNSERCLKCAISGHKSENCNAEHIKCFNCIDANEKMKTNFDVNHSIFNISCPIYLKKIEIQKQKIKYHNQE